MGEIGEGLKLTVGGMGLVFFSLAVLWLLITVLERAFRPKEGKAEKAPTPTQLEATTTVVPEEREAIAALSVAVARLQEEGQSLGARMEDREAVAAISVALAKLEGERQSLGAGKVQVSGVQQASLWRITGRQRMMNSRR